MSEAPETGSLLLRAAYARQRVALDLVPPQVLADLRRYLAEAGDSFDGSKLVDGCLEGRAGDGEAVLRKTLVGLRSDVMIEATSGPVVRSRRPTPVATKLSAVLLGKLIAFGVSFLVAVGILWILHELSPSLDIYAVKDFVLDRVRGVRGG
ncbi:MAG: hypothetical protein R3F30_12360 [Planctomycetota bacterium]